MRTQHPGSGAGSAPVGPRGLALLAPPLRASAPSLGKGTRPLYHQAGQGAHTGWGGVGVCVQADKSPRTSVAALSLHTELLKLDLRCLKVENPHPNVQAMRRERPPPPAPLHAHHCAWPSLGMVLDTSSCPQALSWKLQETCLSSCPVSMATLPTPLGGRTCHHLHSTDGKTEVPSGEATCLRLLSPQEVAGLGLDPHTWPQRGWAGSEPPWELRYPHRLTVYPGVWCGGGSHPPAGSSSLALQKTTSTKTGNRCRRGPHQLRGGTRRNYSLPALGCRGKP